MSRRSLACLWSCLPPPATTPRLRPRNSLSPCRGPPRARTCTPAPAAVRFPNWAPDRYTQARVCFWPASQRPRPHRSGPSVFTYLPTNSRAQQSRPLRRGELQVTQLAVLGITHRRTTRQVSDLDTVLTLRRAVGRLAELQVGFTAGEHHSLYSYRLSRSSNHARESSTLSADACTWSRTVS